MLVSRRGDGKASILYGMILGTGERSRTPFRWEELKNEELKSSVNTSRFTLTIR